jgi:type VI protein secretion system component Hcp
LRKGLLLTLTLVALAATAALFGLVGPAGADGGGRQPPAVGTLHIEGLTPAGEPIQVLAYSWGASNSGTIGTPGGGAGAGKVNLQDLSFTKAFDELSPEIFQALATGEHFDEAILLVDANGRPSKKPTHRYRFGPVLFTSQSQGGSGGEQQLTENVTLGYGTVALTNE